MRRGGRGLPPVLAASGPDHRPAAYEATKALVLTWMLLNLSIGEYLIRGRVFGWPTAAALVFICGIIVLREARRHRTESAGTPDYPFRPVSH